MLSGMETMELNGMKTDLFFSFLLLAEICQVLAPSCALLRRLEPLPQGPQYIDAIPNRQDRRKPPSS